MYLKFVRFAKQIVAIWIRYLRVMLIELFAICVPHYTSLTLLLKRRKWNYTRALWPTSKVIIIIVEFIQEKSFRSSTKLPLCKKTIRKCKSDLKFEFFYFEYGLAFLLVIMMCLWWQVKTNTWWRKDLNASANQSF